MQASEHSVATNARELRAVSWQAGETLRYFGFLSVALVVALAGFVAFSLYEWSALGETQLAMRKPPSYAPYYLGRFAVAALFSALMAAGLYALRASGSAIDMRRLPSGKRRTAWGMLAFCATCAVVFVADARLFNRMSLEDKPLEWISALLPLAASVAFFLAFVQVKRSPHRDVRRLLALAITACFAFALFVIGMEEISWMQRIFHIATPAMFAENQQQEMNLHNMHSIVIGQAYKIAMFVGLVLLPFIKDTAPRNRFVDSLRDFLPSRFVFAISAPWIAFNYNEWNFLASQLFVTVTLAILAFYMAAAWRRDDVREGVLFAAIALFVAVVQPTFLVFGENFVRMWDASEYVELFIAIGLSFYTAETLTRLTRRYGEQGDGDD